MRILCALKCNQLYAISSLLSTMIMYFLITGESLKYLMIRLDNFEGIQTMFQK